MIDPAKLKPSLVELQHTSDCSHDLMFLNRPCSCDPAVWVDLNALLADDDAMERAYSAFGKCQAYSDKERARAAIIASVTEAGS